MRRLVLLLFLACLLACTGAGAQDNNFFFIVGADPQFGMTSSDKDFAQETANFERFIAAANRLRPTFVIVCGDLVNRAGDAAQSAEYLRIAAKLDPSIHLYNLPGNHDIGDKPTPESIAAYTQRFGPDHYSFRVGRMAAIVLDSELICAPDAAAGAAEVQEKWFAAELEKARKDGAGPLVVFMHHSLFIRAADEPDQYFNVPLAARRRYIELIEKYGVTHVFAGHYHRNAVAKDGGLEVVTSGPIGKALGKDPSGLRIVEVRGSELRHTYYGLDEVPARIQLPKPATPPE
jgi:3',5'-cyclic AMP phosphodiesterase CpdA